MIMREGAGGGSRRGGHVAVGVTRQIGGACSRSWLVVVDPLRLPLLRAPGRPIALLWEPRDRALTAGLSMVALVGELEAQVD